MIARNFPPKLCSCGPGARHQQHARAIRTLAPDRMLVTGFVLLIVCANVASLMLVRGMERRRQISLCMALGAQARRLGPVLHGKHCLSLLGGVAGLMIRIWRASYFAFAFPRNSAGGRRRTHRRLPSPCRCCSSPSAFIITGPAFGIAPAWTPHDPIEALRGASRFTARAGRSAKVELVFQAALSLVLLSAAGCSQQHFTIRESKSSIQPRSASL